VRIIMMAQEEPVYMGPYLVQVMEALRAQVVAVAIAPQRSVAGKETDDQRKAMFRMLEPYHAAKALAARQAWRAMRALGRLGERLDERSLDRAARRLGVPVIPFEKANDPEFLERLRSYEPDVIFNQSEMLLRKEFLAVPRIGVVNRHGSALPKYRGRVGSFWAHAAGEKEIGITVHFVDEGVDTGAIIHQERFPSDPRWSYGYVIERVFALSPGVVVRGFERLAAPGFAPLPNEWKADGGPAHKFPTLDEVERYRADLARRRAGKE
jgi:folate-dependent phosphoribosylglycinamide formyltransferase PurN